MTSEIETAWRMWQIEASKERQHSYEEEKKWKDLYFELLCNKSLLDKEKDL